jgi:hypothetical protein
MRPRGMRPRPSPAGGWSADTPVAGSLYDVANSRYELRLRGPIARSLLEVLWTRFDRVSTPAADGTVLIVGNLDQASVRALLALLWDTGHEVLSFEALNHD